MFVLSIAMNKPNDSTRLILPDITSPTRNLLKSMISDFDVLETVEVFNVTSTRFERGSTHKTLSFASLVHLLVRLIRK